MLESCVFSVAQFSQLSSQNAGVIFVEGGSPGNADWEGRNADSIGIEPVHTSGRLWTVGTTRREDPPYFSVILTVTFGNTPP